VDVTGKCQRIVVALNHGRFVPILEAVPGFAVPVPPIHCVGSGQSSHESPKVRPWRLQKEVKVVGHKAVGIDDNALLLLRLHQLFHEPVTVHRIYEYLLSAVSPIGDVVLGSGELPPDVSWYAPDDTTTPGSPASPIPLVARAVPVSWEIVRMLVAWERSLEEE